MNIPTIFWCVPAASIVALAFAWAFYRAMKREDEGTERMREIAEHVRKGAMAYLKQQYKVVGIVFVVLALFGRPPIWHRGWGYRTRGCPSPSSREASSRVWRDSSA